MFTHRIPSPPVTGGVAPNTLSETASPRRTAPLTGGGGGVAPGARRCPSRATLRSARRPLRGDDTGGTLARDRTEWQLREVRTTRRLQ
jgi:hypothetical protein